MSRRDRACAFVRRGDDVLMVRHRHDGRDYWTLPGGAIEPGELPAEAALREVAEETGLVGTAGRELYRRDYRSTGGLDVTEWCFEIEARYGDASLGCDPEDRTDNPMLVAVGWQPLDGLAGDPQIVRALRRDRRQPGSCFLGMRGGVSRRRGGAGPLG